MQETATAVHTLFLRENFAGQLYLDMGKYDNTQPLRQLLPKRIYQRLHPSGDKADAKEATATLFEFCRAVVPVHYKDPAFEHWAVAVIDVQESCIYYLDSFKASFYRCLQARALCIALYVWLPSVRSVCVHITI